MTVEPLDNLSRYVAPPGGLVVPVSGPVDDVYAPGHYVLDPISIRDGCPAPLLADEEVLSHWFVPRGKDFPTEVVGTYAVGSGAEKRGPIARSSWYLLLTTRYVRLVAALADHAIVRTADGWSTPAPGGWLAFTFDLRTVTYFAGSRRRVEIGGQRDGFSGTTFMAARSSPPSATAATSTRRARPMRTPGATGSRGSPVGSGRPSCRSRPELSRPIAPPRTRRARPAEPAPCQRR